MCGIAGLLSGARDVPDLGAQAVAMASSLAHRGPDIQGVWADQDAGIGFGHRRLSIVDLSPAGAQPMLSADGRWVAIYNGEAYNTEDLRVQVNRSAHAVNWRGHSDTEVILEAVARWGVVEATKKLNGIFALALWDRKDRRLWLIRDRLGIKPLYWTRLPNGTLLFGSELRAFRTHPQFKPQLDLGAITAYLRAAYVPAPLTIYQDVYKLLPAHILSVSRETPPDIQCYWNLRSLAAAGQRAIDDRPDDEQLDDLQSLLRDAVGRQMLADVPLGAFLSGGIDSSTVVALMQDQSARPVRTFSIGFSDERFNEAGHAKQVARHLGTDHTEMIVEPDAARAVILRLPDIYDEPFADSSQIPTFLVSQLARRDVTVALSGDGGDECFAGYTRYHWIDRLSAWTAAIPRPFLHVGSALLQSLSVDAWDALTAPLPARLKPRHIGDKIHKGANILAMDTAEGMYRRVVSQWADPSDIMPGASDIAGPWDERCLSKDIPDRVARLRYFDMIQYLPDDILTKVDRASMAVSLEARVPLLDHRVVERCWSLPRRNLARGLTGKWILRKILHRFVPAELVERPKAGFGIPLGDWLRGPLAEWSHDLLSDRSLAETGLFDATTIRLRLQEHMSGKRNWSAPLWTMLMFQAWHRKWA
jgi:asparagine synthase (glutamine-hydrolysing)